MDAQTFLDNFATIAEAPGGVQRLRDFVLDLAASGRLVSQKPAEGAGRGVVEQGAAVISDAVAKGWTRRRSVPEPTAEEIPFQIPATWAWARLPAVAHGLGQLTPDRDFTYLDVSAVNGEDGSLRGIPAVIAPDKAPSRARKAVRSGSVLYSTIRPYLRNVVYIDQDFEPPAIASTAFAVLYPVPGLDSRYLTFCVRSAYFNRFVESRQKGVAYPAINDGDLALGLVPIPPPAEQERIVAKVDELMGLCDELEAQQEHRHRATTRFRFSALHSLTETKTPDDLRRAWERVSTNWPALTAEPEAVQAMRKTILDLAAQGLLVGQSQSDGEASTEVEQARRAKASLPGLRRQPPIGQAHSAASLPNGWIWATVDDLFLVTGGIQKSSKRRPTKHHFPYLRVANVQRGRLDLRELERFELVDGELERLRLEPGDLLVVEGNGSESEIGRCARWNGEIDDCVHQNHLIRCRPMLPGVEHYLLMFLNSPAGMETMKRLAVTTSGLYNLSVAKIRAISFPLPPMAEQTRIREKVDSLLQQVLTLEASLEARDSVHEALAEAAVATVSA